MTPQSTPNPGNAYDASSMETKMPRDLMRLRPDTFIGGRGVSALVHLVDELLANSADEAQAGFAKHIWLTVGKQSQVTVKDDGRGVPIGEHEIKDSAGKVVKTIPTVQAAFTEQFTGGKYRDDGAYQGGSGGMNGMGAKACAYMSREMSVEVKRDGLIYTQSYRNGRYQSADDRFTIDPPVQKPYKGSDTGTSVTFLYDDSCFDADAYIDGERVARKAYNLSRLVPGLIIYYRDERSGEEHTYEAKSGLADFVVDLNEGENPIFKDVIKIKAQRRVEDSNKVPTNIGADVCFQPAITESPEERGVCFTNLIANPEGGTHLSGFRKGLTRALNDAFRKANLLKPADSGFEGSDTMSGMAFAISIRADASSVHYQSQTKRCLDSSWIEGAMSNIVAEELSAWLTDHPVQTKAWYSYLSEVRKARETMLAERRAVKAKAGGNGLDPLTDSITRERIEDPAKAEIYFVEGKSAGGSAKSARMPAYQAILPFRGKMQNVYDLIESGKAASRKKALENADVRRIATAIETGMGSHFDIERLRYHKIILMADADADGGHIIFLWLTCFWQMFPELIRHGHVYVADPPLYSVTDKKAIKKFYFYSEAELKAWARGRASNTYEVFRFKGLGEMDPAPLKETAMNPATRKLWQVTVSDVAEAKDLLDKLMSGRNAEARRDYHDTHVQGRTTRDAVDVEELGITA